MMLDSFRNLKSQMRLVMLIVCVVSLLSATGCNGFLGKLARTQVGVPQLLTPIVSADSSQLIAEVNRLAAIKSLHGKLDIQFQDTSFAAAGIAEKYRSADADVTVQRPGKVFLVIQFALVDIAQMSSDGEQFRVALLKGDEKYRKFVKGTNRATYSELKPVDGNPKKDKQEKAAGNAVSSLSNLRPQHLTDALLVRPILSPPETKLIYSQSEFYEEEPDTRPQAKKGARVVRSYYLLEEMEPVNPNQVRLKRRLWFDRVGSIRLARVQTFDEGGAVDTDITYSAEKQIGEGPSARLPARIELTRPKDQYKLSLTYQAPEAVIIDKEWQADVFVLRNKWQLPEVDLDAPKESSKSSP
jgi:hypothetical protein